MPGRSRERGGVWADGLKGAVEGAVDEAVEDATGRADELVDGLAGGLGAADGLGCGRSKRDPGRLPRSFEAGAALCEAVRG